MSICILIWHFCLSPTHSYLGNYQRIPETQISRLMENFGPCHPLLKFACFRRLVILEGICRHPYSTATEAKAGCWCISGVRWGRYWKILGGVSIVMGKGSGKGLRQLASMNSKNCELWTGEICQIDAWWLLVSSVGKAAGVTRRAGPWELWSLLLRGRYW